MATVTKGGRYEILGLDRHGAPDHRVHGLVNDTHRAAAQFTKDFVSSGFCYCWHRSIDLSPSEGGTSNTNRNWANRVSVLEGRDLTILPDLPSSISRSPSAEIHPQTPGRPILTVRTQFSLC